MNENPWKAKCTKDQIKAMLLEQFQAFWQLNPGIERTQLAEVERAAPLPHAVIASGLRRVGKSTLLAQLAHRLGEDQFCYDNFEEVDFYLPKTRQLFQVAQHLDNPATRVREVRALLDAMQALKFEESLILADVNGEPMKKAPICGGFFVFRAIYGTFPGSVGSNLLEVGLTYTRNRRDRNRL